MIAREEISKVQADKILVQAPHDIPPSMVAEYINRYLTALPDAKTALDRCDDGYLWGLGHRLKGTGGSFGIPALTQIGAVIEEVAQRGDIAELRRQVAELEAYLNRLEVLPD